MRDHEPTHGTALQPKRYLGLELAGAKNQKTALAALEYYPKERKIFLLDIYDKISAHDDQTGDEALLELINEEKSGSTRMGINVPLTLPPCITCVRRTCPMPTKCSVPTVKWMRDISHRSVRPGTGKAARPREFTPYTQRPVELWIRYQILSSMNEEQRLEIDEALGGNKAPLTARMNFLKRHTGTLEIAEVWPKLTIATLAAQLGITRRTITTYRHIEDGVHARTEILDALSHQQGIFIYERDMQKLARSLASFDAFICAYTALLSDTGRCARIPTGFPISSGWVEFPR